MFDDGIYLVVIFSLVSLLRPQLGLLQTRLLSYDCLLGYC